MKTDLQSFDLGSRHLEMAQSLYCVWSSESGSVADKFGEQDSLQTSRTIVPIPSRGRAARSETVNLFMEWKPDIVDLVSVSRGKDLVLTTVSVNLGFQEHPWIRTGSAQLTRNRHNWTFSCYAEKDLVDPEHDSIHIVRLSLIGVEFDSAYYGVTKFNAWVSPDPDDFRVPPPGYNPKEVAEKCTCCTTPCMIVPDGMYVPEFNQELFEKLRGTRVTIRFGPPKG